MPIAPSPARPRAGIRARLRHAVTPERRALAAEFMRFGCVGFCGFVVDTLTVYALRASLGLYWGGVLAYVGAATVTWALNRAWTFRGRGDAAAHRQWALFLLVNLAGFVLNRGTYAILIATVPLAADYPVLAILAGVAAGMFVNFALARSVVFRPRTDRAG